MRRPAEKAITCKRLAIYGTQEAVPALAPLLANEELASWARIALEAIPGPAADGALRDAMGKVQGRLLVGVINSIGYRRDAQAVERARGRSSRMPTRTWRRPRPWPWAASAATRPPGVLEQSLADAPAAVRPAVAEGCVRCAEKYLAEREVRSRP